MTKPTILVRSIILASILLALPIVGFSQATAKLEEYLTAVTKQGFSGTVSIARDGKTLFSKGYGLANREWDLPNTPQTKFRLGSITKQFTASAIMLLQERGKLGTQDPICKYIDNCPAAWNEITVHQLLNHTSGIPSYTNSPEYLAKMTMPETVPTMINRFRDKPLEFKPGEKYKYNNSGYFLLGAIIEKLSGEKYEAFLQKNFFDPLGMRNTGYDRPRTILKYRATGYSRENEQPVNSRYLDMDQPYAAGSLYSTVEDMLLWNEALYGGKAVSMKSLEAMTTPGLNDYGYGLVIKQVLNRKQVSHGGGINGFNTYLVWFPQEKLSVVVLRNQDFGAPGPGKIAEVMAAIVLGEKYELP